ncbi:MAG: cell wall metabolism sensor histidine kinase WalK, partial [Lactobacillus sp.]|nr:cell wall metabolism sensor histidine kinase WalK [Lactobacillus sp.]
MKRIKDKLKKTFNSISTKLAIVFMLMLIATIEVIGAYFTRQLEQNSIENFQSSIQIQNVVANQLASQLTRDNKGTNDRLSRIINDYNNDSISEIIVVDNKDIIRAVSSLNDRSRIGQRVNNNDVKQVTSTGRQLTKIIDDNG